MMPPVRTPSKSYIIVIVSDVVSNAHLQVENETFAFGAAANALNPSSDFRVVLLLSHVHNQKEYTVLRDSNRLTEIIAFECVSIDKLILVFRQPILKVPQVRRRRLKNIQNEKWSVLTSVKYFAWKERMWLSIRQTGSDSLQFSIRHSKTPFG